MRQLWQSLLRWPANQRLWFMLGIGVKRWLVVLGVSMALLGVGLVYLMLYLRNSGWISPQLFNLLALNFVPPVLRIGLLLLVGVGLFALALMRLGANLVEPFRGPDEALVESIVRYKTRSRGPRVVTIGGGTGMPTLLRGLKEHTSNITAIVTVADDGGSSGRLRRELGLLPPGDFRNNLAALASDEALMTQLMQYRFGSSAAADQPRGELSGHAFGNLLLAALTGITGSFDEALLTMNRVLAMRGRVVPSTLEDVALLAEINIDGRRVRVRGESAIPEARGRIEQVTLEPARVRAYPPAVRAILQADLIVLGPGSLYTSVIPNLLVTQLVDALRSARARRVYVCNIVAQPGETDGYDVADHVAALRRHAGAAIVDVVLANDNFSRPDSADYANIQFVPLNGVEDAQLIALDLRDAARPTRHDSARLATALMTLLQT